MSTTEATGTERAKQIRARLNELTPYPDTDDAATAKSLAAWLAMRSQVISQQQLGTVAPWSREQVDLLTILFAAAHALYALDASDPVLGRQVALEIRCAWDDGSGIGEWLWEHLGGEACREIGSLADELAVLKKQEDAR